MNAKDEDLPPGTITSVRGSAPASNLHNSRRTSSSAFAPTTHPISRDPAYKTATSPSSPETFARSDYNAQNGSKRRRGVGVVTPNACTECRRKRTKCDGQKPCSRCEGLGISECVYEVPVRQSKEHLRKEIQRLQHEQRSSDRVFAALASSDLSGDVLARLRSGQPVESISEWLSGAPYPSRGADMLQRATTSAVASNSLSSSRPNTLNPVHMRGGPGSCDPVESSLNTSPRTSLNPHRLPPMVVPQSVQAEAFSPHKRTLSAVSDPRAGPVGWATGSKARQTVHTWLEKETGSENTTFRRVD